MDWSNIPSLAALRAFEAAARHQNFSKAAGELNVTHAAISQHVRSLEAEFSQSLIEREGRGLALTDQGRRLAECLRTGFSTIADGVDDLKSESENRPLNITLTPAFATSWLMPRIGSFWAKHPDISLNINPSSGLVDMRREGFDLAIRYGAGTWPGITTELLTGGDFWVAAHPDLLTGRKITCLADVSDLPFLLESNMIERQRLLQLNGVDFGGINLTLLHTNGMVLSAARAGLGIIIQPKSLIQREIEAGEFVKICELQQENMGYYILTLPNRSRKDLSTFIKWLRSQVDEPRMGR